MSIIDRALELVNNKTCVGLGSGRAAQNFVRALGKKVQAGRLQITGVATSKETEKVAHDAGVSLVSLAGAGTLDITVDGADEVDPNLDLIKGYGHAMVREKIVAASSRQLVILVGEEKLVPRLGARGRLPIEVLPFGLSLCQRRLKEMGLLTRLVEVDGEPFMTENGNIVLDAEISALDDPASMGEAIRAIPGVVDTGLFLGMTDVVLIGRGDTLELVGERRRSRATTNRQGQQ